MQSDVNVKVLFGIKVNKFTNVLQTFYTHHITSIPVCAAGQFALTESVHLPKQQLGNIAFIYHHIIKGNMCGNQ